MCKLLILTNSKKIKNQKAAINAALDLVTQTERSGCGYFGITPRGVSGEKSVKSDMRYSLDISDNNKPYLNKKYQRFGEKIRFSGPVCFHGRTSTNSVSLVNSHPIMNHGWFLSHNGVVTNIGEKYKTVTTNDSEHLLHYMAKHDITKLAKSLTGYYAFSAVSPTLDFFIARDKIAPLYVADIPEIESEIFATKSEHITQFCERMKYSHSVIEDLADDTIIKYDKHGNYVNHSKFSSLGYQERESRFASRSLGYSLSNKKIVNESKLTEAEDYFIDYVASLTAGDTTKIYDKNDNKISLVDFDNLTKLDQRQCYLVTEDGDEITANTFYRQI